MHIESKEKVPTGSHLDRHGLIQDLSTSVQQVEGLADLIASETTEQRKQALKQMSGHLRQYYETWREQVKSCLAFAEVLRLQHNGHQSR